MSDIGEYVIHLSSEQSNFFGSSISVERFQLSQTASVGTEPSILSRGLLSKAAELSDTLNFGYDINVDNRKVVANTGYSYYSAIAIANATKRFWNGTAYVSSPFHFTGSFISETTVVTCAHSFSAKWLDNSNSNRSSISLAGVIFSPGANSYNLSAGSVWYDDYGRYKATDVYIPLSYTLSQHGTSDHVATSNDWAICLTSNLYSGNFTHSTFGLTVPTFSSLNFAQCAGYPGLHNVPDSSQRIWMWDAHPATQPIETLSDFPSVFKSSTLFSNGGSSGSPLFRFHSYIENGTLIRKAYHFGTLSGGLCDYSNVPWEFICSFYCKNTHFLVNLYHYLEGTGNETSI